MPEEIAEHASDTGLIRCFYCQRPIIMALEAYECGCENCGSRKFRGVGIITDAEMKELIERGYEPDMNVWQYEKDDDFRSRVRTKRAVDVMEAVKEDKARMRKRKENIQRMNGY